MATYLLVDTMNTFFRARHVVRGDVSEKVGMAIHITLNAINKCYKQFNADHVVFALEGRSWRKDFYTPYKKNRSDKRAALTPKEVEEDTAFFDAKGNPVIDKKTKAPKGASNIDWIIFDKSMRGDPSDIIFSAYPGVREKGTKNKTGLLEAYSDKETRGFAWNNLMLQRWTDHNGEEHRVLDDYERNVTLVDLTAQPTEIRDYVDDIIAEHAVAKNKSMVGAHFMKFCGKWDMQRIADNATQFAELLQKNYDDMDVFERFEKHSEERNWVKQNEYLWKIYYKINNITEPNSLLKWGEIN